MYSPRTPSKPNNPLTRTETFGGEMALSFTTDFIEPTTVPQHTQYLSYGQFMAKVFLNFNTMSWVSEKYPDLLAPDYGLPLLLIMFKSPDTPSEGETLWYSVSCKIHPYQVEFQGTEELESEKFALALPWEGGVELYAIPIPFRVYIGRLS